LDPVSDPDSNPDPDPGFESGSETGQNFFFYIKKQIEEVGTEFLLELGRHL
jgi:hypothetical protein